MKQFESIAILTGGTSSRFWPLSDKNTSVFLGKTLLQYQLQKIRPFARNLYIVANADNVHVINKIANDVNSSIHVLEQRGNGQDKAVLALKDVVKGEVLIVNGNDVFDDALFEEIREQVDTKKCDSMLVAKHMDNYFPGGYIKHSGDSVVEVIEKPDPEKTPSSYVKLVVDYIAHFDDFLQVLNHAESDDGYEKALSAYIKKGKHVLFTTYTGPWYTLKYPWHMLAVSRYFLSRVGRHIGSNVKIAKTAVIDGNVYIDDNVTISDFTKIVGPAYIGKNTIVGTYAMIRESMIGADCLIGGYAEVTRSYLGQSVSLHRNFVGDCIFDHDILVGGEAVFANFRFDEKTINSYVKGKAVDTGLTKLGAVVGAHVKIGVNASIMPGIKIGSGLHIAPHELVKRDCV